MVKKIFRFIKRNKHPIMELGLAGLVAIFAVDSCSKSRGIYRDAMPAAEVIQPLQYSRAESPAAPIKDLEEKSELPYTVPETNIAKEEFVKQSGLEPGRYVVKPHPYKENSFLIVKDRTEDCENFGRIGVAPEENQRPVHRSTMPVISYPDRIEAYRPLKEGESLNDVLNEGPVDRAFLPIPGGYVPDKPRAERD